MSVLRVVLVLAALALVAACSDSRVSPAFNQWASARWSGVADEAEFHRLMLSRVSASAPSYPGVGASRTRGVAVWMSSAEEATIAYTLVTRLRQVSSLPVELWHAATLNNHTASEFESISNVRVRDLFEVVGKDSVPAHLTADGSLRLGAQALVILNSRFHEVLYLTATTLPLYRDPATVFENAEYRSTGLLMWSSLYTTSGANPMWSIIGTQCTEATSFEQSGALIVVNKALAWNVLAVAVQLRASESYAAMMEGDSNLFRFAQAIAQPTVVPNVVVAPPTPVGVAFFAAGQRDFCAHSLIFDAPDNRNVALFISSMSADVFAGAANVDSLKCFAGVSSRVAQTIDEDLFAFFSGLYRSAPRSLLVSEPNACSVRLSDYQIESIVQQRPNELINIDRFATGETRDFTIVQGDKVKDCGDWFRCGAYGWDQMDLFVKFLNVSATYGSQIDIRTKNSRNRGLGNETFIQIVARSGQSGCDYPTPGSTETHVSFFNMPARSWFILGVAWGPPRAQTRSLDLVLSVRYNGAAVDVAEFVGA